MARKGLLEKDLGAHDRPCPDFPLHFCCIFISKGLNLRDDFCYQIDTVVNLPTEVFTFLTQDRRGAPAIFALLRSRSQTCQLFVLLIRSAMGGQRTVLLTRARIKT